MNSLREREVVNVCDGRRLGYICDMEIDLLTGKITAIVVPGNNRCFSVSFGTSHDIRIPWEKIERIGNDIILVSIPESAECGDARCGDAATFWKKWRKNF